MPSLQDRFHKLAQKLADIAGTPWAFISAIGIIGLWVLLGPVFAYSDTWQLVINTGTTIVTFLMVFLIQNTQNRDAKAFHLKLDELIRAQKQARNSLIDLEDMSEEELRKLQNEFSEIRAAQEHLHRHQHQAIEGELQRRSTKKHKPHPSKEPEK